VPLVQRIILKRDLAALNNYFEGCIRIFSTEKNVEDRNFNYVNNAYKACLDGLQSATAEA
jgi:hypothetical protein